MIIETCRFVLMSEFFKDCPLALQLFAESDPPCTWGDNNRSLVTEDVIRHALDEVETETNEERRQVKIVIDRCIHLADDIYIDLEN